MVHIGDPGYMALDRECSPLVRFRTRDHAVVTRLACGCGRTAPTIRIIADFPGSTTQHPLRIKIEHGAALAGDGGAIERLRQEIAERLRGLLNFAPAGEMVTPDTFEKPCIHKVALIVREAASQDDVKGR